MNRPELTVLVVDDDFRVAAVHQAFVERVPGFRVVGLAHTAKQARELAATFRPDVVLMDVYLPDGDGLNVVRDLLASAYPPIALVISAANDVESVRTALRLGAAHYLVKPFTSAALAQRLLSIAEAHGHLASWPEDATQDNVDAVWGRLRTPSERPDIGPSGLAPTLRLVLDAVASSDGISASEIAAEVGVSRATAQRYLAQLELSGLVDLRLRYGATGRPEHRYTARRG
ncbi:response regulator [Pseudolysinimonas sp.]|uniref:response regulator n=1 Tax=Pseudolysinimonas sp. TaxID=2680009 RepID=UPI003F8016A9